MRTVTLLDLKLGLVKLSPDQERDLHRRVVPVLADITCRLLRERAAQQAAVDQVAAGKEN